MLESIQGFEGGSEKIITFIMFVEVDTKSASTPCFQLRLIPPA